MGVVGEVDATDGYATFILRADAVLLGRIGVADTVTVIATYTDAQARNAVIVYTHSSSIFVGHIELHGRFVAFVNPADIGEIVCIKTG